jgi:hypothetical protein
MRMVNLAGSTSTSDPVYGTAEAGPDGVFELPHEFAQHLLAHHRAHWQAEDALFAERSFQEIQDLHNPHTLLSVVAGLRADVADLKARLAEIDGTPALAPTETPAVSPVAGTAPPETPVDSEGQADVAPGESPFVGLVETLSGEYGGHAEDDEIPAGQDDLDFDDGDLADDEDQAAPERAKAGSPPPIRSPKSRKPPATRAAGSQATGTEKDS